jgi:hypothetical protein
MEQESSPYSLEHSESSEFWLIAFAERCSVQNHASLQMAGRPRRRSHHDNHKRDRSLTQVSA